MLFPKRRLFILCCMFLFIFGLWSEKIIKYEYKCMSLSEMLLHFVSRSLCKYRVICEPPLESGVPENRTSPHINRTSPVYGHNCTSQHLYKPTNSRIVCVLNSSVQCRPIVPACHTTHHA